LDEYTSNGVMLALSKMTQLAHMASCEW